MMPANISVCSESSRIGLGCWAIGGHGWGPVQEQDSIEAIRAAFEMGVRIFDTADCYGFGHSEKLVAGALGENRHQVLISTKGGVRWNSEGKVWKDNSPDYLRQALENSLQRLQLETIPLYFVHWPDGKTPIEGLMQTLEKFRSEGLVKAVGFSNFPADELQRAMEFGRIDVVQVKLNLLSRDDFLALTPLCREKEIRIMAFGCLAEGLLTGKFSKKTVFPPTDHRSKSADFQGQRWANSLGLVEELKDIAQALGTSVANIALKTVLEQEGVGCALFGARNADQVKQNLHSLEIDIKPILSTLNDLVQDHGFSSLSWRN